MTDHRAVMQQALQELVRAAVAEASECAEQKDFDALHAAKLAVIAIAQPEQPAEPVAWFEYNQDLDAWFLAYGYNPKAKTRPLFEHPPIAQPKDKP